MGSCLRNKKFSTYHNLTHHTTNYKHHVLLLGSTVTIQRPTEICQLSLTYVGNDISNPIGCWPVLSWKLKHFNQLNDVMCLVKKS